MSHRASEPQRTYEPWAHSQRGRDCRKQASPCWSFVIARGFPGSPGVPSSPASTRWSWHSPDDSFCTVSPSALLLCRLGCRVSDRLILGRGWLGRLPVLSSSLLRALSPLPTKRHPRVDTPANAESTCGGKWTLVLERNQGGTWRTRGFSGLTGEMKTTKGREWDHIEPEPVVGRVSGR